MYCIPVHCWCERSKWKAGWQWWVILLTGRIRQRCHQDPMKIVSHGFHFGPFWTYTSIATLGLFRDIWVPNFIETQGAMLWNTTAKTIQTCNSTCAHERSKGLTQHKFLLVPFLFFRFFWQKLVQPDSTNSGWTLVSFDACLGGASPSTTFWTWLHRLNGATAGTETAMAVGVLPLENAFWLCCRLVVQLGAAHF